LQEWEHEFQVAVPSFHFSDELLFQTDFSIEVLPEMINMPGGRMASDSEFVPWRTILGELGQSGGADEPAAERQPDHDPGAPAAHELPWLVHFWDHELPLQTTFPSSKKKHVGADRASDSESDSDFQSIVDHESAIHELYEKRLELSLGEADVREFTWQLRGGKWAMANKGVAYDAVMASAEKGVAERMRLNYQMTKSASFSTTAYGDDVSVKLAKFRCHKLNRMLEKWVEVWLGVSFCARCLAIMSSHQRRLRSLPLATKELPKVWLRFGRWYHSLFLRPVVSRVLLCVPGQPPTDFPRPGPFRLPKTQTIFINYKTQAAARMRALEFSDAEKVWVFVRIWGASGGQK
jgi:hypothetical protein